MKDGAEQQQQQATLLVPGSVAPEAATRPAAEAAADHAGGGGGMRQRRGGGRRATVFQAPSFTPAQLEKKITAADELYPWMGTLQLRKLYALFDRWDTDCSGSITPKEMKVQMDLYSSTLFDKIDADGSGKLTWDEMLRLTELLQLSLSEDELREEWQKMNTDNDDSVDRSEFMAWWDLMENGVSMTDLFARFDVGEQDGKISDTEFIDAIALKCEGEEHDLDSLDADQMVRIALEKVRDDVRAIYGTKTAPSVMLHHMRKWRMEQAAGRSCWFSPLGDSSARFLDCWSTCQAVMLGYIALIVPFRLAGFRSDEVFESPDSAFFWLDVLIDCSFILDVALSFRVAYVDEHTGLLETDRRKVAARYLRTWFAIDLVACLPVAYFMRAVEGSGGDMAGGWKHLRAVKTLHLLRIRSMLKLVRCCHAAAATLPACCCSAHKWRLTTSSLVVLRCLLRRPSCGSLRSESPCDSTRRACGQHAASSRWYCGWRIWLTSSHAAGSSSVRASTQKRKQRSARISKHKGRGRGLTTTDLE